MTIQDFESFEREAVALIKPFRSRFGAISWKAVFAPQRSHYKWLVKGLLPAEEAVMVYGAPQTGKSFLVQDISLSVARGLPYQGRRTLQRGVIYCASEGGKGFVNRQRAYANFHKIGQEEAIDHVVLTRRLDLFADDTDIKALIEEIRAISAGFEHPLGLVVFDTYSAMTPGASETESKDVSRIRARIMLVVHTFQCTVIVVHHKPKGGGSPRGHGSMTGDYETTIDVDWDRAPGARAGQEGEIKEDADGRPLRRAVVTKQREGEQGVCWRFVLRGVEVGVDEDGDPVTSCVVAAPSSEGDEVQDGRATVPAVSTGDRQFLEALADAIDRQGVETPQMLRSYTDAIMVAHGDAVRQVYMDRFSATQMGTAEEARKNLAVRWKTATDRLLQRRIIGSKAPYIWFTGTEVKGVRVRGHLPKTEPKLVAGIDDADLSDYLRDQPGPREQAQEEVDDVLPI